MDPDGCDFVLCTAQTMNMRRLSRTCVGVKDFLDRIVTPVMDIIVTRRDKTALLAVEGIPNGEGGISAITELGGVWGI